MTKETICTNGQGGPGMLKIARGRQIFLWHRGVPASPLPSQNGYVRLKKEISQKNMKIS